MSTAPVFDHLRRLTDGRALFEHALFAEPRPEHGYCVDDVARGLVVLTREDRPALNDLAQRYLAFTVDAVQPDGRCHNRMDVDGRWSDEPGLGDWWGRALWGLGVAAAAGSARALLAFRVAAVARSPHRRSMVFAALGAGELLLENPADPSARRLLRDGVVAIGIPRLNNDWPWPESRLGYGNGSLVEVLLLAGATLPDDIAADQGLTLLDFLLTKETQGGHLSVTPVGGRGRSDTDAAFDQQPIEVAAIADACARAHELTGDERWRQGVAMAWAWFAGDNDSATIMYDPLTGGGFDGLQSVGRNSNQGAESTLAMLSTAQHARRLGVLA